MIKSEFPYKAIRAFNLSGRFEIINNWRKKETQQ